MRTGLRATGPSTIGDLMSFFVFLGAAGSGCDESCGLDEAAGAAAAAAGCFEDVVTLGELSSLLDAVWALDATCDALADSRPFSVSSEDGKEEDESPTATPTRYRLPMRREAPRAILELVLHESNISLCLNEDGSV